MNIKSTEKKKEKAVKRILISLLLYAIFAVNAAGQGDKPNVLFIAVDDLNDWTGYLNGHPQTKTPSLDALASQSVAFSKAYCNSPSCNPSRASLLLGKHPHSLGFYRITHIDGEGKGRIDMRKLWPDKKTIPQYFQEHNYNTFGTGKIFHLGGDWAPNKHKVDLSFMEYSGEGSNINVGKIPWQAPIDFRSYKDYGPVDRPHSEFEPYKKASRTIDYINRDHDKPFFIACGFYLPHLPWYFPADLLDSPELAAIKDWKDVELSPFLETDLDDLPPQGVKEARNGGSGAATWNGTKYQNWHDAFQASGLEGTAVQAYLASIYFVDLQLGRILTALNNSPHKDNTIIVLWSDHGWMLGHKEGWEKFKPWEQSVKVPFLIKAPGIEPAMVDKPVELLSIYKTLIDLAGLPEKEDLDGVSLEPLLKNPDMDWNYPVVTVQRFPDRWWQSVRTNRYRYIRYMGTGGEELYDHATDSLEWYNIASRPDMQAMKEELNSYLPEQYTPLGSWNDWEVPQAVSGKHPSNPASNNKSSK
jgi:arylsulfatase A-like enzyme